MNPQTKSNFVSVLKFALAIFAGVAVKQGWLKPDEWDLASIAESAATMIAAALPIYLSLKKNSETHTLIATLAGKAQTSVAETKVEIKKRVKADASTPEYAIPIVQDAAGVRLLPFASVARAPKPPAPPREAMGLPIIGDISQYFRFATALLENENMTIEALPQALQTQRAVRNETMLDLLWGPLVGFLSSLKKKDETP